MLATFEIAPARAPLPSSRWLTCPRPDRTAPLRLWCVPFAGGGAAVWHAWAAALAGLTEIIAIRSPGRENRLGEAPLTRLWDYVAELLERIAPFANEEYALCGHSLGAYVAFELIRALRTRGLGLPRALIVCGARAPHHRPDLPLLHALPRHEFLIEVERRYGAIPAEIRDHPEFLELLLPALRADLEMYETYEHTFATPLEVPVLALGGDSDTLVSPAQVLDWRAHTTGEFEAEILPGGHFFPQDNLALTTRRVRAFLSRFVAGHSSQRMDITSRESAAIQTSLLNLRALPAR
jgi:medium-chain acyl-[acyl-carrier-protein] hydrolase